MNDPVGSSEFDELAINNFRKYLTIKSVQPNIDYDGCVKFLKRQAKSLRLPVSVHWYAPGKPTVVMTWPGTDHGLPSLLLNSHMDVVPVFEDNWKYEPFGGEMDDEGNIYGRGAQDMKCVGIQFLEAIRRLQKDGTRLKRTVHVCFSPDEETGSYGGMRDFSESEDFEKLNIGCGFDEGITCEDDTIKMFYGEKCIWQVAVHCPGQPGHGSAILPNSPGEKITYILQKYHEFRREEENKLNANPDFTTADITTVNLTELKGGVEANVVPEEFAAYFDIRIPQTVDFAKFEATLNDWCKEAGEGVWLQFIAKDPPISYTKLDNSNPFWIAYKKAADELKLNLKPRVCPGTTDGRFLRKRNIPVFGMSPISNTQSRIHGNNEFLNANTFLKGIHIFCKLITAVANV